MFGAALTVSPAENSDEPSGPVAVAVATRPTVVAGPVVVHDALPTVDCPSGSTAGLVYAWIVTSVLAVVWIVPRRCVFDAVVTADVITGKFCRLFGPVSASFRSFGVTPSRCRSMPRP